MTDRYRGYAPPSRAPPNYNPARSSMPASIGYSSLYAGDVHVMPSSARSHPVTTPRGYSTSVTSSGVPTTTRTYAVSHEPRSRHVVPVQEPSRPRRSTLESGRPPVIVTTSTTKDRPSGGSSHSSGHRTVSPVRDEHSSREGRLYAQPASSIRSRSGARNYGGATYDVDNYSRARDRRDSALSARDVEAYRNSRPSVSYPSDPRHSTAAIDYGEDGYSYTNAGDLAKYDLDQSKPSRPRRRESVDKGYYRPNVNYNSDQRSLNVNSGADLGRHHSLSGGRPYESGRAGPPPSTRGFDRINQRYEDFRDMPPPAPAPPRPTSAMGTSSQPEGRRSRPISLYQDVPRSSHHDDYYRSREDERAMRDLRDFDRDGPRSSEPSVFRDESVTSRGFGIRTDPRREDGTSKRWSGDPSLRGGDLDRDERRLSRQEIKGIAPEKGGSRRGSDEDERDHSRLRDTLVAAPGVAAAAAGIAKVRDDDKRDPESRRRRSPVEDRESRPVSHEKDLVPSDRERERYRDDDRARDPSSDRGRHYARDGDISLDRPRDERDKRTGPDAVAVGSDSDESRRGGRRRRPSHAFNPNDTSDLKQLKDQLAAMNPDKDRKRDSPRNSREDFDEKRSTQTSPSREGKELVPVTDDSSGRELAAPQSPGRQVRLVSPPRDKKEDKPIKGILKQPKVSFPEEANPIREGVAPHKDDKKFKEAPAGAKWTKISRKIVNPEALSIGKERFEVRDDFVIVLRVLSKDEIQTYASATQVLREMRRKGEDPAKLRQQIADATKNDDEDEEDDEKAGGERADGDESRHHHHRHHHHHSRDGGRGGDDDESKEERERERRRRRRREEEEEAEKASRDSDYYSSRSARDRERERAVEA